MRMLILVIAGAMVAGSSQAADQGCKSGTYRVGTRTTRTIQGNELIIDDQPICARIPALKEGQEALHDTHRFDSPDDKAAPLPAAPPTPTGVPVEFFDGLTKSQIARVERDPRFRQEAARYVKDSRRWAAIQQREAALENEERLAPTAAARSEVAVKVANLEPSLNASYAQTVIDKIQVKDTVKEIIDVYESRNGRSP